MKTPCLTIATLFALFSFLVPSSSFAQDEDESPVGKEMKGIGRDMKKLSRQYTDAAQKESSLEIVASAQKHVENCRSLTPSKSEKAADKAKYMTTFKKDLDDLGNELVLLKDAIAADKTDVAKTELDKIGKLKISSHKELGVGGGRRGGKGEEQGARPAQPGASPAPATSASPAP